MIFSKDRAMQLDAVLASFFAHVKDAQEIQITVLYKTSTAEHQAQYELLTKEYTGRVEFIPEIDFRRQMIDMLISTLPSAKLRRWYRLCQRIGFALPGGGFQSGNLPEGHVLFLVDDNIFIRSIEITKMADILDTETKALGFSLRLGRNTTYCYSMNMPQSLPDFVPLPEGILKFNWTTSEGDFAYPLEVSSSVYSVKVMLDLIMGVKFHNPNTLEAQISKRRSRYIRKRPVLLCNENSSAFCVPINRVQSTFQNRAGQNEELSAQRLAELFGQGFRIDVETFNGFVPNACHQEVALKFLSK